MYPKKSLLGKNWKIKDIDEKECLMISQRHEVSINISELLFLRNIKDEDVATFFDPNFFDNLPDPFILKDMKKSIDRTIDAIKNHHKIGIIADYDVDGSTSAAVLSKFLSLIGVSNFIKVPERLVEGYGPNKRIMDEFSSKNINLIFTLDCGTTSFDVFEKNNNKKIDIIVIDHHISEQKLPNVYSMINPNRFDENNIFKDLAAVGITFIFIMGLRKKLREINFFKDKIKEPNILNLLDLVALGTICDVVNLKNYNRIFVKKGLDIIKKRSNIGISKIIDNSNINYTPKSSDIGYIIGPQLNAASRLGDSTLSSKILTSNNLEEIDKISKKLILLNEKRKLIENNIFEQALLQINKQLDSKYILVHGFGWHQGVLGIVASRLVEKFQKPSFVISNDKKVGVGSARSVHGIDLGNIILNAKNHKLLISGGGHKMAAGIKINNFYLNEFKNFLNNVFEKFNESSFENDDYYDLRLSANEINIELLEDIERLEPFGNGNEDPKFIIQDLLINSFKILKNKHLLIFLESNNGSKLNAICFNCIDTELGENLTKNKSAKFELGCMIRRDHFNKETQPQLIIKDAIIIN